MEGGALGEEDLPTREEGAAALHSGSEPVLAFSSSGSKRGAKGVSELMTPLLPNLQVSIGSVSQ